MEKTKKSKSLRDACNVLCSIMRACNTCEQGYAVMCVCVRRREGGEKGRDYKATTGGTKVFCMLVIIKKILSSVFVFVNEKLLLLTMCILFLHMCFFVVALCAVVVVVWLQWDTRTPHIRTPTGTLHREPTHARSVGCKYCAHRQHR